MLRIAPFSCVLILYNRNEVCILLRRRIQCTSASIARQLSLALTMAHFQPSQYTISNEADSIMGIGSLEFGLVDVGSQAAFLANKHLRGERRCECRCLTTV
jgi:hypothetical protein